MLTSFAADSSSAQAPSSPALDPCAANLRRSWETLSFEHNEGAVPRDGLLFSVTLALHEPTNVAPSTDTIHLEITDSANVGSAPLTPTISAATGCSTTHIPPDWSALATILVGLGLRHRKPRPMDHLTFP